jgi:hypothetical protein
MANKKPIGPVKENALHEKMGVKKGKPLPSEKVNKIAHADVGDKVGNKKVTALEKKEAVFAENAKKWNHSKKK